MTAGRPRKVSDEAILAALEGSDTYRAVADSVGLTVSAVHYRARKLGASPKRPEGRRGYHRDASAVAKERANRARVLERVEALGSQSAAARELGISRQAVWAACQRARAERGGP